MRSAQHDWRIFHFRECSTIRSHTWLTSSSPDMSGNGLSHAQTCSLVGECTGAPLASYNAPCARDRAGLPYPRYRTMRRTDGEQSGELRSNSVISALLGFATIELAD